MALTHGAGSNCNAALLIAMANAFADIGVTVYRYDLPFRLQRPKGPPFPTQAEGDRDGVRNAVQALRKMVAGHIWAGGHSYGGRQTAMAAAEDSRLVEGLVLLSYPLHPPDKLHQMRTVHFPGIRTRSLFVHGAKDGFGTEEELKAALNLIPAETQLYMVEKAGHDLGKNPAELGKLVASRALQFLG